MLRSAAVVGDRLSPFVAAGCVLMAVFNLTRWLGLMYGVKGG